MGAVPFHPSRNNHPTAPSTQWELVDLSGGDWIPRNFVPRYLFIGGAGNLSVCDQNGGSVLTAYPVQAGWMLPLAVGRIVAATTTATNILALK
jgi:hypothetical protein